MKEKESRSEKLTPLSAMTSAAMPLSGALSVLFILFFFYDFVHFSVGIVFGALSIIVPIGILVIPRRLEKKESSLCIYNEETEQKLKDMMLRALTGGGTLLLVFVWIVLSIHFFWSMLAILFELTRPAGLGTWFSTGWLIISMASIVAIISTGFIVVVYRKFKSIKNTAE